MLFWFSPILAAWHDVPPVKAMFFSFVSCWRNRGAFIVFGALWFAVALTVSLGLSALMQALGAGDFAFAILMPATMIVTTDAVLLVLRDLSRLLRRANARNTGLADHAGG